MAEDLMIGFNFNDRADNLAKDTAVVEAMDLLFVEAGFDPSIGHLRNGEEDEIRLRPAEFDDPEIFESFDYADGFDFGM